MKLGTLNFGSWAWLPLAAGLLCGSAIQNLAAGNAAGLIGDWALTLPSGEAGWLSVREGTNGAQAELLWAVGSMRPVKDFRIENGTLSFWLPARRGATPGQITGQAEGDMLHLTNDWYGQRPTKFTGTRMPPLPSRPNLAKVRFGQPITLFNGRDLTGWRVSNPSKKNGWSARDGVLRNDTPKTDFSAYGDHANLRTDAEFEDFHLRIEYCLPPEGGNSGVYLRGLYEAQVTHRGSSMQGINGPGAIFGRIAPTTNAGKPAGEWETYELTLVDRHVTVVLNGVKVIDNQPVAGPTGGALQSDVTKPGPIFLQGDHTSVEYRNIVLRPALK